MDTNRAVPLTSAALVFVSMFVPWWEGDLPLTLETHTPKMILGAGVLMLVLGLIWREPLSPLAQTLGIVGPLSLFVTMVAFYAKVDDSEFAPEKPFTQNIELGFVLPMVGLAFAGVTMLLVTLGWIRPSIRTPGSGDGTG